MLCQTPHHDAGQNHNIHRHFDSESLHLDIQWEPDPDTSGRHRRPREYGAWLKQHLEFMRSGRYTTMWSAQSDQVRTVLGHLAAAYIARPYSCDHLFEEPHMRAAWDAATGGWHPTARAVHGTADGLMDRRLFRPPATISGVVMLADLYTAKGMTSVFACTGLRALDERFRIFQQAMVVAMHMTPDGWRAQAHDRESLGVRLIESLRAFQLEPRPLPAPPGTVPARGEIHLKLPPEELPKADDLDHFYAAVADFTSEAARAAALAGADAGAAPVPKRARTQGPAEDGPHDAAGKMPPPVAPVAEGPPAQHAAAPPVASASDADLPLACEAPPAPAVDPHRVTVVSVCDGRHTDALGAAFVQRVTGTVELRRWCGSHKWALGVRLAWH